MEGSWARIEAHLAAAGVASTSGAAKVAVNAAQREIGVVLPAGLTSSLLRHDGLGDDARPLLYGTSPCSVSTMLSQWRFMNALHFDGADEFVAAANPERSIRAGRLWRRVWVPIAAGDDDHLVLDLDPDEGGTFGQVFSYTRANGPERIAASSYSAWLALWADDLDRRAPAGEGLQRGPSPAQGGQEPQGHRADRGGGAAQAGPDRDRHHVREDRQVARHPGAGRHRAAVRPRLMPPRRRAEPRGRRHTSQRRRRPARAWRQYLHL